MAASAPERVELEQHTPETAPPPPGGGGGWAVFRTVVATAVGLVVVLAFVAALFLAVITRENPRGVPGAFGQRAFVVLSGSMTGTFSAGDLILDRTVSLRQADHLHRGQVISFEVTSHKGAVGSVITHRIYRVRREINVATQKFANVYETKGDANPVPDDNRVQPQQVLGVYEFRVPDAGYLLADLHQPLTFVLMITIPFAMLVVLEARRRWNGPDGKPSDE